MVRGWRLAILQLDLHASDDPIRLLLPAGGNGGGSVDWDSDRVIEWTDDEMAAADATVAASVNDKGQRDDQEDRREFGKGKDG